MRIILIALLILIHFSSSIAQVYQAPDNDNIGLRVAKINQLRFEKSITFDVKQIDGSAYLNRELVPGIIVQKNGVEFKDMPLRYNIYNQCVEFKQNGTVLSIAEPQKINYIIIGNQKFVYAPFITSRNVKSTYFQQLTNDKFQLLKKYEVVLKKADPKAGINDDGGDTSCRFDAPVSSYYLRYQDGMAHRIDSRKQLIKLLQPIPQEIIDYILKNNVDVKNENQLIDLLKYTSEILD